MPCVPENKVSPLPTLTPPPVPVLLVACRLLTSEAGLLIFLFKGAGGGIGAGAGPPPPPHIKTDNSSSM